MGILDDAIRQHLELKRRSGADPSDVAKLEHEAFGPIERGDALGVPAPEAEPAYAEPEPDWPADEPEPVAHAEPVEPAAKAFEPPYDPATAQMPVPPDAGAEMSLPGHEPAAPEPGLASAAPPEPAAAPPASAAPPEPTPRPPVREPEPRPRFAPAGEQTVEFSALDDEPDPQPDAEPGEHDELEETPEFLAETPEHDRLWFEQKPPRDFDF